MRNLLNFLARYTNLIIFLILEGLSFYYLATRNTYHNTRVMLSFRSITRGVESRLNNTRSYLHLREINEKLAAENVALKNKVQVLMKADSSGFHQVTDSLYNQQYVHISAEVIDNTINRQKNFFTLNKGMRHGIRRDMSIISAEGIAGVIVGCTENYSIAMSLLNLDFKVSARLRSNGYFGSLSWDGRNYRNAILSEIPQHVNLSIGDTIETTGYSAIFPEGLIIGTVRSFDKPGGDFYRISVQLSTDFKKLNYVDIIGNVRKEEQLKLQSSFK